MDSQAISKAGIKGESITISFGSELVLRDFSFEIPPDQHTIFKGESGSGKSTLLKMLLSFVKADTGELQFGDADSIKRLRAYTAWLPQELNLGEGTVEEVMREPFTFRANKPKSPDNDRLKQTLNKLGLDAKMLEKPFRNLSTGQRQRVGLALCNLLDKPILLLDEPTSALDSVSKKKVRELMVEEQRKRTIISTSHDPEWLETADKVIELD